MATKATPARTNGSKDGQTAQPTNRRRVLLIEDNPLTVWVIEQTLSTAYEVVRCSTLEQANTELARSRIDVLICGSPVADEHPEAVKRLAEVADRLVVALVSDPDSRIAPNVRVLEKPFDLSRLTDLLANDRPLHAMRASKTEARMAALAGRLYARFEKEICPLCVHRTADGGCTLTERRDCPVFEWARQLAELVENVESDRLADYMDKIQAIVCPSCIQRPDGKCVARDHLDCPLDLYLGLVVPIIEDELKRLKKGGMDRPFPQDAAE